MVATGHVLSKWIRSWRAWLALAAAVVGLVWVGSMLSGLDAATPKGPDLGNGRLVFGRPCIRDASYRMLVNDLLLVEQERELVPTLTLVKLSTGRVLDRSPFSIKLPTDVGMPPPVVPGASPTPLGTELRFGGTDEGERRLLMNPCRYELDDTDGLTVTFRKGPRARRYRVDPRRLEVRHRPLQVHPNRTVPNGMNVYGCRSSDAVVRYEGSWGVTRKGRHHAFATRVEGQDVRATPPFLCDRDVAWNSGHVWRTKDGALLYTLQRNELAGSLAPSATGRYVIGATSDDHRPEGEARMDYPLRPLWPVAEEDNLFVHTMFVKDLEHGTATYFPELVWEGYESRRALEHKWIEDDRLVLLDGYGIYDVAEKDFVSTWYIPVFGAMSAERNWVISYAEGPPKAIPLEFGDEMTTNLSDEPRWVGPHAKLTDTPRPGRLRLVVAGELDETVPEVAVMRRLGVIDDDYVVFTSGDALGLMRVSDGAVLYQVHQLGGAGLCFTPSGHFGGDFDAGAGRLVTSVRGDDARTAVASEVGKEHVCYRASLLEDFFGGRPLPAEPCLPQPHP